MQSTRQTTAFRNRFIIIVMHGANLHAINVLLRRARQYRLAGNKAMCLQSIEEARAWNKNTIYVPVRYKGTWITVQQYLSAHDTKHFDWRKPTARQYLEAGLHSQTVHEAYKGEPITDADEAEYWADWEMNQEQLAEMPIGYDTIH